MVKNQKFNFIIIKESQTQYRHTHTEQQQQKTKVKPIKRQESKTNKW